MGGSKSDINRGVSPGSYQLCPLFACVAQLHKSDEITRTMCSIRPVCVCMLLMTIFTMVCFQYMNFTMKIVHTGTFTSNIIIMTVRFWHRKNKSSL